MGGVQQRDAGSDVIERKLQEDILGNCPSHSMCDKIKAGSGSAAVTPPPLVKTNFCGGSNIHLLLTFVEHQHSFTTFFLHHCINIGKHKSYVIDL